MSQLLAAAAGTATVQVLQVIGALMALSAFVGAQYGVLHTRSRAYLVLNVLGAGTLTVLAALDRQYGFLLLEAVWTLVSLWALRNQR